MIYTHEPEGVWRPRVSADIWESASACVATTICDIFCTLKTAQIQFTLLYCFIVTDSGHNFMILILMQIQYFYAVNHDTISENMCCSFYPKPVLRNRQLSLNSWSLNKPNKYTQSLTSSLPPTYLQELMPTDIHSTVPMEQSPRMCNLFNYC